MGFFDRFKAKDQEKLEGGLEKTKSSCFGKINRAGLGNARVDDEVLDKCEEVLVMSDVGVKTTVDIIQRIDERVSRDKYVSTAELNRMFREEISSLMLAQAPGRPSSFDAPLANKPQVIMVGGVNGVGKTRSIGKIAYRYKGAGHSALLGAADRFRAAACEQLDF